MRIYETMFIIDPNLEDATRDELANRVKSWIEEKVKGEVKSFDRWGMRQLAFRVDKFLQGDYTVVIFDAEPQNVKALEEMYRITPQIFRWMVFRREDLEKHRNSKEKVEQAEDSESMRKMPEVNENSEENMNEDQIEKTQETEEVENAQDVESKENEGENS